MFTVYYSLVLYQYKKSPGIQELLQYLLSVVWWTSLHHRGYWRVPHWKRAKMQMMQTPHLIFALYQSGTLRYPLWCNEVHHTTFINCCTNWVIYRCTGVTEASSEPKVTRSNLTRPRKAQSNPTPNLRWILRFLGLCRAWQNLCLCHHYHPWRLFLLLLNMVKKNKVIFFQKQF